MARKGATYHSPLRAGTHDDTTRQGLKTPQAGNAKSLVAPASAERDEAFE